MFNKIESLRRDIDNERKQINKHAEKISLLENEVTDLLRIEWENTFHDGDILCIENGTRYGETIIFVYGTIFGNTFHSGGNLVIFVDPEDSSIRSVKSWCCPLGWYDSIRRANDEERKIFKNYIK